MFSLFAAVASADPTLNDLLQLAVEQRNWFAIAVIAVLIIVPLVLKLVKKDFPGQDLIATALTGLAKFLTSRPPSNSPVPEADKKEVAGVEKVIQIIPEEDEKK